MPSSKTKEPQLQLTISLSEVTQLQSENSALKKQVAELQAENEALKKQMHDLTDPGKQADAAAFKRARGNR